MTARSILDHCISIAGVRRVIGIDIGGTKISAAHVDESGKITNRLERPTDPRAVTKSAISLVHELQGKGAAQAIGVAFAGWVEHPSGLIALAPNLPNAEKNLGPRLAEAAGLAVLVENDVNAAVWAELILGAGIGESNVVMLAVGTGLGGGIVIDGDLYRGSRGFAGEFGHMTVVSEGASRFESGGSQPLTLTGRPSWPLLPPGPPCACGRTGCLESVASGTALARLARERIGEEPGSVIVELVGGDLDKITGEAVGEAAAAQDPFALRLFEEVGTYLGIGIASVARAFDPDVVIVGGGVADIGEALLGPARAELGRRFEGQAPPPKVVPAALGNDAGMIGAALLARQNGGS